jgi:hypothetical protein
MNLQQYVWLSKIQKRFFFASPADHHRDDDDDDEDFGNIFNLRALHVYLLYLATM